MSMPRLLLTALGLTVIAGALSALTPPISQAVATLGAAQRTADAAGGDVVVLHATALLAWLVWGWGALGLGLTALTTLPGRPGHAARTAVRRLLPAGARRAAAVALGIGLGVVPPAVGAASALVAPAPATAAAEQVPADPSSVGAVPDWPAPAAPTAGAIPDWPPAPAAGEHVVVRGDCLWLIVERRLAAETGRDPGAGDVAAGVHAWWQANAQVIGPDPDRLLPGQVLRPPDLP